MSPFREPSTIFEANETSRITSVKSETHASSLLDMIIIEKKRVHSSMGTDEFLDISESEDSNTDSFNTLSTFYYNGYKKRHLQLRFPAKVTRTLYQYQIHEQRNQRMNVSGQATTNMIYLKPKQVFQRSKKIIYPYVPMMTFKRQSLTYMKTDDQGRKIVYRPHIVQKLKDLQFKADLPQHKEPPTLRQEKEPKSVPVE